MLMLVLFAISFGVSLASKGIERINGAIDQPAPWEAEALKAGWSAPSKSATAQPAAAPVAAAAAEQPEARPASAPVRVTETGAGKLIGKPTAAGAGEAAAARQPASQGAARAAVPGAGAAQANAAEAEAPTEALSYAPQTSVDRFASKTGELLQITANHGIKLVVSLFDEMVK